MNKNSGKIDKYIVFLFFLIPTLMVIVGYFINPYPTSSLAQNLSYIPLFLGLILLGIGFFWKKGYTTSGKIKILGWMVFSFFWSMQINALYFGVDGDFVNAFLCVVGIYVLNYLAYHEWLSLRRKEQIRCLNWAAGAATIAGLIYFIIEFTPLAPWLIETVAAQSGWLLNIFIGNVEVKGVNIFCDDSFVVSIIFACTAVQSMVLFVGMILPLTNVEIKRKIYGLLITVVPIYFLNLIRNALVAYLVKDDPDFFFMAHNVIGKGGSLIVLVILLFIVIKIVPEVFDEIADLTDLPKRKGPVENFFAKFLGKTKK